MNRVAGYVVWYADGSSCSSRNKSWDQMPADGVLMVMLYFDKFTAGNKRYAEVQQGHEHYFRMPDGSDWIHGYSNDSAGDIQKRYPGAIVKRGKWASNGRYAKLIEQAFDMGDF
jgi:hypothetical protein